MHRRKWSLLLGTALVTAALVVACGDDDTNPAGPTTGTDAGDSGNNNKTDTGTSGNVDSGGDTGTVDGGCNFATFVSGLINTQTNATGAPSTDLGEACKDNQDQKEFAPLFQ